MTSPIQAVHIDGGTEPARDLVVRGSLNKIAMATIIGNLIYKVRKRSQSIILLAYPSSVRVEVLICDGGEAREGGNNNYAKAFNEISKNNRKSNEPLQFYTRKGKILITGTRYTSNSSRRLLADLINRDGFRRRRTFSHRDASYVGKGRPYGGFRLTEVLGGKECNCTSYQHKGFGLGCLMPRHL
jgi:hypothetical protein